MNILKNACLSMLLILSINMAGADIRQYQSGVVESRWEVTTQTRLSCELQHNIPGYGNAVFASHAAKQLNMEFVLDILNLPNRYDVATVYSLPPKWMPGKAQKIVATMDIRKQYNGDLPDEAAWTLLTELEKGYWPTIYYQDWNNSFDNIKVGLNAANFLENYRYFAQCISNLLPYEFEDIAYTVLSYKKNSIELTKYAQKRLNMISDYLKEDPDLELVLLDGHTDSWGMKSKNEQLSMARATEIKDFFAAQGVESDRIEVTGHGEKRFVSPNNTEAARTRNRRVIVRLSKP